MVVYVLVDFGLHCAAVTLGWCFSCGFGLVGLFGNCCRLLILVLFCVVWACSLCWVALLFVFYALIVLCSNLVFFYLFFIIKGLNWNDVFG